MASFEIVMPKLGESITQATIIRWLVKEGDPVLEDDNLLDIATDKVDSEIPSPVAGTVEKIFFKENDVVPVGTVIAIIDTGGKEGGRETGSSAKEKAEVSPAGKMSQPAPAQTASDKKASEKIIPSRFYSPLVKQIAQKENISLSELETIKGSGRDGRVQKKDILSFIENRVSAAGQSRAASGIAQPEQEIKTEEKPLMSFESGDVIIEMDRVRRITADHMIKSVQTSAHVTNMLEADVTPVVNWRNRVKDEFEKREGLKLTYLPVFLEAVTKAIKEFPVINSSVDGDRIILKKRINLGIAVALPDTNLIVPVIKNADNLNIAGLAKEITRLASAARNNKLKPEDISDGTFTVTNFGTFRNTIGTPIINQPQVAILGIGTIEKKPAVLETPEGDVIAIRHKMFLSLTYDHRIINGAYAGAWLRKVADYLEQFDHNREI